jgi:cytosine permease
MLHSHHRNTQLSKPVPLSDRVPWYKNTFPTYIGIFLWVGFYLKLAEPTIGHAGLLTSLLGLIVGAFFCFALYYYVPAMLGMKTGQPLYVIGTSTFGVTGGYFMPGLLMRLLQLGWVAVITSVAVDFVMKGLNQTSRALFSVIALLWIYTLVWAAIKGIRNVGQVANLNWAPLIMILLVFWSNKDGIARYQSPHDPLAGFLNVITMAIGYFATAGVAGADFGRTNRTPRDIVLGGAFGGRAPILSVAGYIGRTGSTSTYDYIASIARIGVLAPVMFLLFAAALLVPTCFSSFIASNSFTTMLPNVPRSVSTLAGVSISAV